ncbi:MAG: hypothetical protein J1E60_06130 [Christensenellaceae bacterium]|nr:hypothetical protein [Christensenellaceae bacterium]
MLSTMNAETEAETEKKTAEKTTEKTAEKVTETTARKPARRRKPPKLKDLTSQALNCLSAMITDETAKPSDRLNAVKTVLDYAGKVPDGESSSTLKVIFESIDPDYTE